MKHKYAVTEYLTGCFPFLEETNQQEDTMSTELVTWIVWYSVIMAFVLLVFEVRWRSRK